MLLTNETWDNAGPLNGGYQVHRVRPADYATMAYVPVLDGETHEATVIRADMIAGMPARDRHHAALMIAVRELRFNDALTLARGEA